MQENYLFTSERLGYRRLVPGDVVTVFSHHREASLAAGIPNEVYDTLEEARETVDFLIARFDAGELPYILAVCLLETGEMIGTAGVCAISKGVEIDYAVREAFQRQGFGAETVRAVTAFCGERFPCPCLYGMVARDNVASRKTLERAGYRYVGMEARPKGDPYEDGMHVYRFDYITK